jgi:hypothetical protein
LTWVLVFSLFFFFHWSFFFSIFVQERPDPLNRPIFEWTKHRGPRAHLAYFVLIFLFYFFPLACLEFSFVVSPSFLKFFSLTLSSLSSSFFMSFYYYYLLFLIILLKLMQRIWLNQVYDPWRGFFPLLYNTPAIKKHQFLLLIFFLSSPWWNVDHIASYIIMLALYEGIIVNQKFLSLCLYIWWCVCVCVFIHYHSHSYL